MFLDPIDPNGDTMTSMTSPAKRIPPNTMAGPGRSSIPRIGVLPFERSSGGKDGDADDDDRAPPLAEPRPEASSLKGFDGIRREIEVNDTTKEDARALVGTEDTLPSYDQLKEANGPRFGRWAQWSVTIAHQPIPVIAILLRLPSFRIEKRARERTLDDPNGSSRNSTEQIRRDPASRFSLDSSQYSTVASSSFNRTPTRLNVSRSSPPATTAPVRHSSTSMKIDHRLTPSAAISSLGSKFERQLVDAPKCAVPFPSIVLTNSTANEQQRFNLVGTENGLSLLDLDQSTGGLKVLGIWSGLGVFQLEIFEEKNGGALLALVDDGYGLELRMWSSDTLTRLVKWRIYTEGASELILNSKTPTSPFSSKSKPLLKSLFAPNVANGDASSTDASKGKARASLEFGSSPSRHHRSPSEPTFRHPSDDKNDASSSSNSALPLEWARSSTLIPLPKGHGPILFFRLSRAPSFDPVGGTMEDEHVPKSELLHLIVATNKSVFVYLSRPLSTLQQRRTWILLKEYYAPSTPKFVELVKTLNFISASSLDEPHDSNTSISTPKPVRTKKPLDNDSSLLLGLNSKLVLIRLVDSSVHEIHLDASASKRGHRRRAASELSDLSTTSASSSAPQASSVLFNARKKAQAHVENLATSLKAMNSSYLPAGLSKDEVKGLTTGRRMDLDRSPSSRAAEVENEKWTSCVALGDEGYFLTRGKRTCLIITSNLSQPKPAIHDDDHLISATSSTSSTIRSAHVFTWPDEICKLSYVFSPASTTKVSTTYRRLAIIAFSETAIHVQEGLLTMSPAPFADSVWAPITKEELDSEFDDKASFDFSRRILWLADRLPQRQDCELEFGHDWFGGDSLRGAQNGRTAAAVGVGSGQVDELGGAGCLFAVRGMSDWSFKCIA